jgi:hypothetical protein
MMQSSGKPPTGKAKVQMSSRASTGQSSTQGATRASIAPGLGLTTLGGVKGKMRKREKPKPVPKPISLMSTATNQEKLSEPGPKEDDDGLSTSPQLMELATPMQPKEAVVENPHQRVEHATQPESPPKIADTGGPMDEDDLFGSPISPLPDEAIFGPPTSDDTMADANTAEHTPASEFPPAVPSASEHAADVSMGVAEQDHGDADIEMTDVTDTPVIASMSEIPSVSKSPKSRLKKRMPSVMPAGSRVTRSSSLKRKADEQPEDEPGRFQFSIVNVCKLTKKNPARKRSPSSTATTTKPTTMPQKTPTAKGKEKAILLNNEDSSELSEPPEDMPMPSRASLPSFARPTASSLAKTPVKPSAARSPSKIPLPKSGHSSPIKLARSNSFSTLDGVTRPSYNKGSALHALTNALEKLRKPTLSRPGTSMGFEPNDVLTSDGEDEEPAKSTGPSTMPNRKSQSLEDVTMAGKGRKPLSSGAQRTLPFGKSGGVFTGTGAVMRGGINGRGRAPKASRNPGLPMVIGSPVKGGKIATDDDDMDVEVVAQNGHPLSDDPKETISTDSKAKLSDSTSDLWKQNAARRASLASQALSQSVSALPAKSPPSTSKKSAPGSMGPPATPPRREGLRALRSTSGSQPSGSSRSETVEASKAVEKKPEKKPTLDVLKGCRVFVDVYDNEGTNLGDFYSNMLMNLGARVFSGLGQTCTHIVYRNGRDGTLKKWK